MIKLVGIGKYSKETIIMKKDISEDRFTSYYNMLNSDYDIIVKTTEDDIITEMLKGNITQEEFNLKNTNFSTKN